MIKLFRNQDDYIAQKLDAAFRLIDFSFDELFQSAEPASFLEELIVRSGEVVPFEENTILETHWLPPIGQQEIWAAGVTYYRSRSARMEESEQSGGDHFYDLVYEAPRPELFFKATAARARGHLAPVRTRQDSDWDVPEPELTLALNSAGNIFGYTIGNDMSSRSIEGENPLYLPQAKIYRGSCAIGPCLLVADSIQSDTRIAITIERNKQQVFSGETKVSQIKREFSELAEYLFRENEFSSGAYLMTGTGVVPGNDFTLQSGDIIRITIDEIGTLTNYVE
jgi:2-dehydro-3-deoxy-D-arabinonate dehydratase